MQKYYVRWGFSDEYGNLRYGYYRIDWFVTLAQAEDFIKMKQKGNGSYFEYKPPRLGDYERFVRYNNLLSQVKELEKEFE